MIDTRVTEWIECNNGPWYPNMKHGGYVRYRIWQQFDGLRWHQRHEWQRADSSIEISEWIAGSGPFIDGSQSVEYTPETI